MEKEWSKNHSFKLCKEGGTMEIEKKVLELLSKPLEKEGVQIDSVVYEKEGGTYFLRVVIDKIGGVDIDTCVDVTHIINPILDEADIIEGSYILDVSSKESGDKDE